MASDWRIEGAGVELRVTDEGAGPDVLVLHGLGSDAEAWREPAGRLVAGGVRAIVPDRRGYGGSGAPEPYVGTTVEEQAEDAAAVLRMVAHGPAVLAGDGLGALIALDLAKRHRDLVRGVALGHPPLFAFVPEATQALAAERQQLNEALREGGPALAVARWLGPGVDPGLRERIRASQAAFFADFAGLATWPVTRRELRGLDVPAVHVTHPLAPAHVVAASDRAAALLPRAERDREGDLVAAALRLAAG